MQHDATHPFATYFSHCLGQGLSYDCQNMLEGVNSYVGLPTLDSHTEMIEDPNSEAMLFCQSDRGCFGFLRTTCLAFLAAHASRGQALEPSTQRRRQTSRPRAPRTEVLIRYVALLKAQP